MEMEKFKDDLKQLGKRVIKLKDNIGTEEATKTSLIMPFLQRWAMIYSIPLNLFQSSLQTWVLKR